jgi:hypothetical protein
MDDASAADETCRSVELRAKRRGNRGAAAVTMRRAPLGGPTFAGKKASLDPFLTMQVLYQLSYVGATPNPTLIVR